MLRKAVAHLKYFKLKKIHFFPLSLLECLLRLNHNKWHENISILVSKHRLHICVCVCVCVYIYIHNWGKEKKLVGHSPFSKSYKWVRAEDSKCSSHNFFNAATIQNHSGIQTAREAVPSCTELRALTGAVMWPPEPLRHWRQLRVLTALRCLSERRGKATSMTKNCGPYD